MIYSDDPLVILDRIAVTGQASEVGLNIMRQALNTSKTKSGLWVGKDNVVNLGQEYGDLHIGDLIYQGANTNRHP